MRRESFNRLWIVSTRVFDLSSFEDLKSFRSPMFFWEYSWIETLDALLLICCCMCFMMSAFDGAAKGEANVFDTKEWLYELCVA